MTTPTRFDDTERIQPAVPPPTKKNDAHAKNTTQMGTVMTSAVSATASPPRTPMLSVEAVRESMKGASAQQVSPVLRLEFSGRQDRTRFAHIRTCRRQRRRNTWPLACVHL